MEQQQADKDFDHVTATNPALAETRTFFLGEIFRTMRDAFSKTTGGALLQPGLVTRRQSEVGAAVEIAPGFKHLAGSPVGAGWFQSADVDGLPPGTAFALVLRRLVPRASLHGQLGKVTGKEQQRLQNELEALRRKSGG